MGLLLLSDLDSKEWEQAHVGPALSVRTEVSLPLPDGPGLLRKGRAWLSIPWAGPQVAEFGDSLALKEPLTLHPSDSYCIGSLVFLEG